jgi:cell wall-associated NlpC family hydrolase
MSDSPSTTPARPAKKTKFLAGALTLIAIALVVVLVAKPFSGPGTATAKSASDDPYALSFDGDNFSGKGATNTVKTTPVAQRDSEEKLASACASCAKKHQIAMMPAASSTTHVANGAPTSKALKKLLKAQRKNSKLARGDAVELAPDGSAVAPLGAPDAVQNVVAAANVIKNYPYIWGGGHGSFQANGYDCSGSVSYALKGANLLNEPLVSGDFMTYGDPGPGKWITIYSSGTHVFMFVGGLRYDTSYRDGPYGTRWQDGHRPLGGFTITHPVGL